MMESGVKMSFVSRLFTPIGFNTWLALLVSLSLVFVYFRLEPAPADYMVAIAIAMAFIGCLVSRSVDIFRRHDLALVGYLLVVGSLMVVYRGQLDIRFAIITIYLGLSYFAVVYAVARNGTKALSALWWAYIIGATLTAVVLIAQLVWVYSLGGHWDSLYFGRPNAGFKDANVAGPSLLPAIFYLTWQFYSLKDKRYLAGILLLSAGLFCTFSRGAYLGFFAGLLLISLLFMWQQYRLKITIARSAIGIVVLAISLVLLWCGMHLYQPFASLSTERFGTLIKNYDTEGRAVSWQTSVKEFAKQPLGTGSGSYEQRSTEYQQSQSSRSGEKLPQVDSTPESRNEYDEISGQKIVTQDGQEIILTPSAHNTYLRVLLENGVPGVLLLLLFWVWLAVKGFWTVLRLKQGRLQHFVIITWVSFIAFIPMGLFIDTLHWRFLWIMAGLLSAALILLEREAADEPS